jgi:predicted ArsR family transcriptional regulator
MGERDTLALYEEIIKIRQLLELLARSSIKLELEKVATTEDRKKVWGLCDGHRSTSEISQIVGISQRAIQIFLKELQDYDLMVYERRGYPKRKFEYVPSGWEVSIE